MRKLTIKTLKDGKENYADVLITILRGPKNGSNTTYEEMSIVVPLVEKLELLKMPEIGNVDICFEEAEWDVIVDRIKAPNVGFRQNEREALDMCNAILEAEHVDAMQIDMSPEGNQTAGENTSEPEQAEG